MLRERVAQLERILLPDDLPHPPWLSPYQFRFFQLLMSRPFVSFDALAIVVWGDDPNGGPEDTKSVLRQMVYALRQRLHWRGGAKIQTVYDQGYQMSEADKRKVRVWLERELNGS